MNQPGVAQACIGSILAVRPVAACAGTVIGHSREGRAIRAFRIGTPGRRLSLLAGCHADEPVGPRTLRYIAAYLSQLPPCDPLVRDNEWWIVPQINPDGERRNIGWQQGQEEHYDCVRYLLHLVREQPGDDIEFGFPSGETDSDARPENRAVFDWWRRSDRPFALHVSLHGMAFGAGPWFLIDEAWRERCSSLMESCRQRVDLMGYTLHDVERLGEKGFVRIDRGFCTRPDSRRMRESFAQKGDHNTAAMFRPSSMETIREFGGDPLTLVTEMPLFITPGVGRTLGPPDPVAEDWKRRVDCWRFQLARSDSDTEVRQAMAVTGLRPMPVRHQMDLQLTLVFAGLALVGDG